MCCVVAALFLLLDGLQYPINILALRVHGALLLYALPGVCVEVASLRTPQVR